MEMKNYQTLPKLLLAAICSALPLAGANAATVLIDGVKNSNDVYTNSITTTWTNAHNTNDPQSIYGDGVNGTTFDATMWYTTDATNLYLYLETPIYAKNMVWGTGVSAADQASYQNQYNHHNNETLDLDYNRATGSEGIAVDGVFGDLGGSVTADGGLGLQNDYKSSLDWLLDDASLTGGGTNGAGYDCGTTNCNGSDVVMSFEMRFLLSGAARDAFIVDLESGITQMHLSPERGNLSAVPLPAAAWLFGSVLMGFGALKRKKA
jgi:hypothetical protein